ncbi:MAG: hypothetical protein V4619_10500 [Bacteroidota bacterium]
MENRKYALIFLFLLMAAGSRAQSITSFEQADSVSNAQYLAGNWAQLIQTGKYAIAAGYDSPALRQRLGYAQMLSGNYSKAIKEYKTALKNDSYNTTARYYTYLCHQYLNHDAGASYHAAYLDTSQRKAEGIHAFGLINAGIESSAKFNDNVYRQTANYSRVYLSNRLGWRLQLTQSVAYFNQYFLNSYLQQAPGSGLVTVANTTNQQIEYYAKLSYSVTDNLQLLGAYHYLNSNYLNAAYNNQIGFGGLRYNGTHFALQGDVNIGYMIGEHLNQYNATLMLYPMGNLDFYTVSRVSYLQQGGMGRGIFSQSLGYKLAENIWAETSGNFGNLNNYNDTDGLYIYNAIDPSKLKLGQTFFFQLGRHAQLQLNYTYEKKDDEIHTLTYNQHSITAGLSWKF